MDEGAQCSVCFQGELSLQAGMLICDVCGSVVQGFAEEEQEFQTGISDARFFRKQGGGRGEAKAVEAKALLPVAEAVQAYVALAQELLQKQSAALEGQLGVSSLVGDVVRQLWFAYLPTTGLLDDGFAQGVQEKLQRQGGAGGRQQGPGEPRRSTGSSWDKTTSHVVENEVNSVLPLRTTLALCALGCWHLREAVSALDVARWALDGRLPYLQLGREALERMQPYRGVFTPSFFTSQCVPTPHNLYSRTIELAAELRLSCPPVNVGLWLDRYTRDLGLPPAVAPVALELYRMYRPYDYRYHLQYQASEHPWAHVMALLLLAVKLLYGLDGKPRPLLPHLPPPPDWLEWARAALEAGAGASSYPLSTEQALELSGPRFQEYMQYLGTTVFGAFEPPEELRETHAMFQRLAAKAAALAGGAQQAEAEERESLAAGEPGGEPEGAEPRPEPGGEAPEEGLAITFFGTTPKTLPPDYAAVLAACAAHVWLIPQSLQKLVTAIEEDMIAAECEVAFKHDGVEQARLAKIRSDGEWLRRQQEEYKEARTRLLGSEEALDHQLLGTGRGKKQQQKKKKR